MIKNEYVGEILKGKENNFDFIRFLAASFVIFTHAFPLSSNVVIEPFLLFTNGQASIGNLSVITFFITSGFLITMSFDQSKDPVYYFKSRILRIFPALIVLILLTVFVLGPIVSTHSFIEYFSNPQTYTYLKSMLLHPMQYNLPGVFENNVYSGIVNGSLWTLEFEFLFYFVVLILGVTHLLNKKTVILLFLVTFVLSFFNLNNGKLLIYFFSYFSAGMVIYLFKDKIPLNKNFAILSFIVLLGSVLTVYFLKFLIIFGSYLLIYFAFSRKVKLYSFSRWGDFSYGLYIFAFPIQQTLTQWFGGKMNPYVNFVISYPITLFFAVLSWHFIEKKALLLKKKKAKITNLDQVA